jgi:ABC-type amino acid transport substrate-binding protein
MAGDMLAPARATGASRAFHAVRAARSWRCLAIVAIALALTSRVGAPEAATEEQAPRTVLRVAVKPIEPFVFTRGSERVGFSIDLWNAVAQSLHVDTAWVDVASVDEQLQAVKSGVADAAIAAITITKERDRTVDFTQPYFDSGLQILVKAEGGNRLLDAFGSMPWATIGAILGAFVAVMFVMAHVVWIVERRANEQFRRGYLKGIGEGLWAVALIVATGEHGDREGSRIVKRLIVFVMWLAGVVVIAQLTATVTSTQTVARLNSTIHGPEDLPGKRMATVRGTVAADYLSQQGLPHQDVASARAGRDLVLKGEVQALVFDAPTLQYLAAQESNGALQVVGPIFAVQKYGIAVPDGSPLRKRINDALLQIYEDGRYKALYDKWFSHAST